MSLFLIACQKNPDEILPVDPVPLNLTSEQVLLIESENSFAFDIFKKVIAKSGESENIIISPLSVSCALSMALNGANGATRDAMLEALKVNGMSCDKINNSYKDLTKALLSVDKRVLITIANSVWTENNFVVKKPFSETLTNYYNTETNSFEISDPLAPARINSWIESKTNGLIRNMIQELKSNTVMLLINAIYFKGKWKSEFKTENTVQGTFYKQGNVSAEVPVMIQSSDFGIYSGEGFDMAEFPYGQGNFVMDVILPDDRNGTDAIVSLLSSGNFNGWLNKMRTADANVLFPRFKYGFKKQLKDVLTDMGMGIAFTENADFTNISDIDLLINEVIHQAFIETNEEGTEAAAATIVGIGTTSMPVAPIVFKIDHPFIYIIRETTSNSILFIGKVADPLAE